MDKKGENTMRNPVAKSLRSPHLAPKIVKPKKGPGSYDRKKQDNEE